MPRKPEPPKTRATVELKSGRTVRKTTIYLPPELARRLGHWCVDHDADMSTAIVQAVERMLEAEDTER